MKKITKTTKVITLIMFSIIFLVMMTSISTTTVEAAKKPAQVKKLKISNIKSDSVTLKWKKVKKAIGYKIYRKDSITNKFEHVETVYNKRRYKDLYLEDGTYYSYKVRAVGADNKLGKFSKVKKVKTKAYKEIYDMDIFDDCWIKKSGYVETTFGDSWYDCIELQIPYYEDITESYVEYYTNEKYNWFSGELGLHKFEGEHPDYVINIYGDDKLLYTSIPMNKKTSYQNFKVNISGCKFVKISTSRTTYWGGALIHNGVFTEN